MDRFEAKNALVDALIHIVDESLSYDDVLSELKVLLGSDTVARLPAGNSSPLLQWGRLVQHLSELDPEMTALLRILERYVSKKTAWMTFCSALNNYRIVVINSRSGDGRLSTSITHQRLIERGQLNARLRALSSKFYEISPDQLDQCLNSALNTCHPSIPHSQRYFPVFSQGPIPSWDVLLERIARSDQCFDPRFLDILERYLSGNEEQHLDEDLIGSLVIMLLQPSNKPSSDAYTLRAYYCSAKAASVDHWVKVFDPATDYQIRHINWQQRLQALLPGLLREARAMRQSPHEQLLVEIFLPTELIDADIHTLQVPLAPSLPAENLGYSYPIVARSSWRYQTFVECQAETILDPPLLHRWRYLSRVQQSGNGSSFWWHDTIGQANGPQAQGQQPDPKDYFVDLKGLAEFFGMKRLADIPDGVCYQTWTNKLMAASPAIALWWPPTSTSQPEQRQNIFTGSNEAMNCTPFGLSKCDLSNAQSDPFDHPDASDPLKLFYALASAVYRGQFNKDGSGQAFREMVLLVDSHERWPPPLDRSPVSQPSPDGSGPLVIDADEMLMPR
jgi:hypothetical protein